MTLEPQAAKLLSRIEALGLPEFETVGHERARTGFESRPPAGHLVEVAAVRDDSFASADGNDVAVRVYTPTQATHSVPLSGFGCLIYFHGGGWVVGSIETHDRVCRALTELAGVVTVSVDYRLAPEHKFPTAAEDCYAAVGWAHDNAERLGIDAAKLAVGGDSAGGNLAAATALMCRDREGPSLAQQLLIYPVTDFDRTTASMNANAEGFLLTRTTMTWFDDHYLADPSDAKNPYAAPLACDDLSGVAPAVVIVAGHDPLRDEGVAYAERLSAAQVPTTLVEYPGQFHGFFTMTKFLDQAVQAQSLAAALLSAQLGATG